MSFVKTGEGTILSVIIPEESNLLNEEASAILTKVKEETAKAEKDADKQDKKLES